MARMSAGEEKEFRIPELENPFVGEVKRLVHGETQIFGWVTRGHLVNERSGEWQYRWKWIDHVATIERRELVLFPTPELLPDGIKWSKLYFRVCNLHIQFAPQIRNFAHALGCLLQFFL